MPRAVAALLLAVPLGIALGFGGQLLDRIDAGLTWAAALGVPWLAVAFGAGAVARRRGPAALAGSVALVTGTGTWYALHLAAARHLDLGTIAIAVAWAPAAALSGAAFALAGAEWRRRRGEGLAAAAAVAALAGALVGEAVLLSTEWPGRAARAILAAELVAGALLPLLLVRRRAVLAAVALTLVAAVVMGVTEHEIRDVLRHAGWRGR